MVGEILTSPSRRLWLPRAALCQARVVSIRQTLGENRGTSALPINIPVCIQQFLSVPSQIECNGIAAIKYDLNVKSSELKRQKGYTSRSYTPVK